jgi:hypothetical protein
MDEIQNWARLKSSSVDEFILAAIEDRLADLRDRAYVAERASRGNAERFARILAKTGSEPPREGDEIPAGWWDQTP